METTEAIKAMFDRFDKNGDGKITRPNTRWSRTRWATTT